MSALREHPPYHHSVSYDDYTGMDCEGCGRPEFYQVVPMGRAGEKRRGPSCWHDDCEVHRDWFKRSRGGTLGQ